MCQDAQNSYTASRKQDGGKHSTLVHLLSLTPMRSVHLKRKVTGKKGQLCACGLNQPGQTWILSLDSLLTILSAINTDSNIALKIGPSQRLVAQSCLTLFDPMDCSTPGFPDLHYLLELGKLMSIELGMPYNHLILCHPLLLLPSNVPSIRVYYNESALRIRWPKYWSFSFSICPSNEYSGLISSRTDWFDLLEQIKSP